MRDPNLRNPGDGGVYAVSDEWLLLHPPEGQWAHLAGACVRYEGAVANVRSPAHSYHIHEAEPSV